MNRRTFLKSAAAMASCTMMSAAARADVVCGPPDFYGRQRCEAGIRSHLAVIQAQKSTQWCWAACIAMVFRYYGHPISQARIVEEVWGSIVDMPAQPSQILQALNRPWVDDNGRKFGASGTSFSANPITAAQDLAANRPLIIGTQGHAMVLTSLKYVRDQFGNGSVTLATVRDPWPTPYTIQTQGKRSLTAQEWYGTSFLARIRIG